MQVYVPKRHSHHSTILLFCSHQLCLRTYHSTFRVKAAEEKQAAAHDSKYNVGLTAEIESMMKVSADMDSISIEVEIDSMTQVS